MRLIIAHLRACARTQLGVLRDQLHVLSLRKCADFHKNKLIYSYLSTRVQHAAWHNTSLLRTILDHTIHILIDFVSSIGSTWCWTTSKLITITFHQYFSFPPLSLDLQGPSGAQGSKVSYTTHSSLSSHVLSLSLSVSGTTRCLLRLCCTGKPNKDSFLHQCPRKEPNITEIWNPGAPSSIMLRSLSCGRQDEDK